MLVFDIFLKIGLVTSFVGEGLVNLINSTFVNGTVSYTFMENYHQFLGNYSMLINP